MEKDKDVARELQTCAVKGIWDGIKGVGQAAWTLGKVTIATEKLHFKAAEGAVRIVWRVGEAIVDPKTTVFDEAKTIGAEKVTELRNAVSTIEQSMPVILDYAKDQFEEMWGDNACLTQEQALVEMCKIISGELFFIAATGGISAISKLRYASKVDDVARVVDGAIDLTKRGDFLIVHADNPAALTLIRQNPNMPVMIVKKAGSSTDEATILMREASKIPGRPAIVFSESVEASRDVARSISKADLDEGYGKVSRYYRTTTQSGAPLDGISGRELGRFDQDLHNLTDNIFKEGVLPDRVGRYEMGTLYEARDALGLTNHSGPVTRGVLRDALKAKILEQSALDIPNEVYQFRVESYYAVYDYLVASLGL